VQLTPWYDGEPILRLEVGPDDPSIPLLRQRRRLSSTLARLDDDQWATPSRCEGWTVRDVISHLTTTNQFWALSATAGRAGEPTRFLATFDPVATPAQLVDRARAVPAADVLAEFDESTEALAAALAGVEGHEWSTVTAEAPPGHVELVAMAAHALWDSWVHERDVLLPLGLPVTEEPDEVEYCLDYAVALGPALAVSRGRRRTGRLAVEASDPDVRLLVDVGDAVVVRAGGTDTGDPCIRGTAVDLLEGLSFRTPLDHGLADDHRWLLEGLDEVFDLTA
jgi:uncharacterized protein (TIGR03083 family)